MWHLKELALNYSRREVMIQYYLIKHNEESVGRLNFVARDSAVKARCSSSKYSMQAHPILKPDKTHPLGTATISQCEANYCSDVEKPGISSHRQGFYWLSGFLLVIFILMGLIVALLL